jgi:hypothetical protein
MTHTVVRPQDVIQFRTLIKSKILWRWYIGTYIVFLDIIHRPVFIWNRRPVCFSKRNISKTNSLYIFRLNVPQLGPVDKASPSLRTGTNKGLALSIGPNWVNFTWRQTKSSLRNFAFWKINRTEISDRDRTMDNAQNITFVLGYICFSARLLLSTIKNIVTRFARQRDKNNVDSSDLTRKFIGTIAEITHNRYYTQFRVW